MKLLLLSSPDFFVEEDKIITTLFEEGLDILHLRKPNSEPVYCERLLTLVPECFHNRIVTNDHFYLKEEFGLMGIHLSRRNPVAPEGYRGQVTRSLYSLDELARLREKGDLGQYCILNNVFKSVSRPDDVPYEMEDLRAASRAGIIGKRVMAQSGINLENIPVARELGFGGVVVCNDIWTRFNIHGGVDYKGLISHFHKLKRAIE